MDAVIHHFWVAGLPLCSTTLLVAPGGALGVEHPFPSPEISSVTESSIPVGLELFDIDGVQVNEVRVDFPVNQVGLIELEPYCFGLKYQGGLQHGRVKVLAPSTTRIACRYDVAGTPIMIGEPRPVRTRESSCIPISLGPRREHLLVVVNVGTEDAQVGARLFYGERSPEWSIDVPAGGSRVVGLEHGLLVGSTDKDLSAGVTQGYVRFTARQHSFVTCKIIERVIGEGAESQVGVGAMSRAMSHSNGVNHPTSAVHVRGTSRLLTSW